MGCRITEGTEVALYDSTTNEAFGPIFPSHSDAEEFIEWLYAGEKIARTFPSNKFGLMAFTKDARVYHSHELQQLHQMWPPMATIRAYHEAPHGVAMLPSAVIVVHDGLSRAKPQIGGFPDAETAVD